MQAAIANPQVTFPAYPFPVDMVYEEAHEVHIAL